MQVHQSAMHAQGGASLASNAGLIKQGPKQLYDKKGHTLGSTRRAHSPMKPMQPINSVLTNTQWPEHPEEAGSNQKIEKPSQKTATMHNLITSKAIQAQNNGVAAHRLFTMRLMAVCQSLLTSLQDKFVIIAAPNY
jgi:hypothetical protein